MTQSILIYPDRSRQETHLGAEETLNMSDRDRADRIHFNSDRWILTDMDCKSKGKSLKHYEGQGVLKIGSLCL